MKKVIYLMMLIASVAAIQSCSQDSLLNDWGTGYDNNSENQGNNMPGGNTTPSGTGETGTISGELTTFDVSVNKTALTESETVDTSDEDYIEYSSNNFSKTVNITYDGNSVTYDTVDGVTISSNGAHVTVTASVAGVRYVLSGSTSNGSLTISDSDKKYALQLNGVSITNPTGAAIYIPAKKRCYVVLADGTENTLTDGSSYTDATSASKGAFYCKGKMLFSGSGTLNVYGNYNNGIHCTDYIVFRPNNNVYVKSTANHGIKANDGIDIKGGVLNIEVSGAGAKGINCEANVYIRGGRTTILTTGAAEVANDSAKGASGIKSDSAFVMKGGQLYVKSTGNGGKGIKADETVTIDGGEIAIITTGSKTTARRDNASPKGIKADKQITINGGSTMVRTTGGEGSEGIESKTNIVINSGTTLVYAYDDAINASKNITINGGYTYAYAINNDGIDSNGTLTITGGVAIACGTSQPEDGFDCDQNTFTITGGTAVGIGGGTSTPTSSACKQAVAAIGGLSLTSGQYLTLNDSKGNNLLAFKLPRTLSQATVLVTSPLMSTSNSYTLSTGATVSGGSDDFMGYLKQATVSGGSSVASFTQSSTVYTSGVSSMGGGGAPGGMGGGGRR